MTEPVLKMVGLAVDDKPNKAAEIFSDEMADRAADYVPQAKDVISNGMMGQELQDSDVEVELDPEIDSEDDSYEEAEEVETSDDDDDTYEAEQEVVAEPEDDNPSEETEEIED